jgi:phytoene/squalene synthetase
MHLRLPAEHDAWLTEQAKLRGVSKTYLVCRALDTLRDLEPSPEPIGITTHAPLRRIERVS